MSTCMRHPIIASNPGLPRSFFRSHAIFPQLQIIKKLWGRPGFKANHITLVHVLCIHVHLHWQYTTMVLRTCFPLAKYIHTYLEYTVNCSLFEHANIRMQFIYYAICILNMQFTFKIRKHIFFLLLCRWQIPASA